MRWPIHDRARQPEKEFESLVVDLFRRSGWRVQEQPGNGKADLLAESDGRKYVIEVKRSAESRPDRLVPRLLQAIIQAQSAARHVSNSAIPVAIVGSPHISSSVAEQVKQFALKVFTDER
jgi:hypothetical protein